jgi:hypothetical protein
MNGSALSSYLTPIRRRIRLRDGWLLAQRTLWIALGGMIGFLVVGRLVPILGLKLWALLPIALWLCAVITYTIFVPRPLSSISRQVDWELGLKERLSTAYEIELRGDPDGSRSTPPPIIAKQQHDAVTTAQGIRLKHAFPLRWLHRPIMVALGFLAIALLLIILPNQMDTVLNERLGVKKAAQEQAEEIKELKQEIIHNQEITPDLQAEMIRELDKLIHELHLNPGERNQALADLSKIENELHPRLDPNLDLRQSTFESISSQLQSVSRKANIDPPSNPQALEKLAHTLSLMNKSEKRELAQSLAQMATRAAQAGNHPLAQALATLSQAALQGDSEAAFQAANQVAQTMTQAQTELNNQQVLKQVVDQLKSSSLAVATAGLPNQQTENLSSGQSDEVGNTGQGQNGQGISGGGTKADTLPPGTGSGQAKNPENIDPGAKNSNFGDEIFVPWERRVDEGGVLNIPGNETGQGEIIIRENSDPSSGLSNTALIPYQQFYVQYIEAAQTAINSSEIPSAYRDLVREYFIHIEP